MGIEFNRNKIDCAHYIGKPYMGKKKNKFDQLLLDLAHENREQPFTKPDQEFI